MNDTTIPCPTKVYELLKIALTDLEKGEKDEKYIIDMGIYHEIPDGEEKCHICQAGSVMAFTLNTPFNESIRTSDDFSGPWKKALMALNCFRIGGHSWSFEEFYFPGFNQLKNIPEEKYSSYKSSPEQYKKWAWAMQRAYEAECL